MAKAATAGSEECELIGETADELWFTCDEAAAGKSQVTCTEEDFGVGGGPGILPQEGEVLCKQAKPRADVRRAASRSTRVEAPTARGPRFAIG